MKKNAEALSSLVQASSPPIRVLVVEDESVVAFDVKACLEELGYSVPAIVASGEAAIAKARELHPDIVLMDICLQDEMDGIEAAHQIWNELQIPVIYATGYSDKATVARATETELFGYILKPIKERDLHIAISIALQQHQRAIQAREKQRWMAKILKAIGDGVVVTNAESQVKYLNLMAESLTGWRLQEAMDRPLSQVFPLLDSQTHTPVDNPVNQVLRTGEIAYLIHPVLLVTKEGKQISIADSAAPLRDDQGNLSGVVMVFRDVTERQSLQEQAFSLLRAQLLEQQVQELQRLDQLKDDFLNLVSHELRSPLANIKTSIRLLEINLNRPQVRASGPSVNAQTAQVEQYLRILREQCDQEAQLVDDLLELQRLQVEDLPLHRTEMDVVSWISQMTATYQERAHERLQHLQVILPPALPPLVSDTSILTNILGELLTNACKYTPPEETITVRVKQVEDQLQIMVSNSGVEIPEEELPRIFDKFYRISGSDRWNQGGTGLGLALVRKQISCLGGSIHAESQANEVHFIMQLPFTCH